MIGDQLIFIDELRIFEIESLVFFDFANEHLELFVNHLFGEDFEVVLVFIGDSADS